MKNILEFAKKAREAYMNYISKQSFNIEVCNKINDYINKIEYLNEEEEDKLTNFINENATYMEHVADIQIPEDNKHSIKSRFGRIIPMKLSNPSGKIYKANGHFKEITGKKNVVKIRRLTKFKPKK